MPFVPAGGGLFFPAGNIVNEPANQLINQSGIQFVNKLKAVPDWAECEGYKEVWAAEGISYCERFYEGAWVTRKAFIDAMLGYSTVVGGKITRAIPQNHEEYPWLYSTNAELVQGKGAPSKGASGVIEYVNTDPSAAGGINPGVCRYKITQRDLDYDVRDDTELAGNFQGNEIYRYVTRNWDYAIKSLPIPNRTVLRFYEGPFGPPVKTPGLPIDGALAQFIMSTREVTYTWHQVPDVPQVNIDLCVGNVNLGLFDEPINIQGFTVSGYGSETNGYADGTLLFLTPKVIRHRSIVGRVTFTIIYKFLYQPQGWNKFPTIAAAGLQFFGATFNGTANGPKVYQSALFDLLFATPNTPGRYQNDQG